MALVCAIAASLQVISASDYGVFASPPSFTAWDYKALGANLLKN